MSLTGIVFLLFFFAGIVLTFKSPIYGLYTYIGVFYVDPPSRWWGDSLPNLRWSLVASIVALIAVWRMPADKTRPSWISTTPAKILIIYTIWIWLQNFWALLPDVHYEFCIVFTKYIVLYYVMYRLLDNAEHVRGFLLAHIIGCFYLGILAYTASVSGRLESVGGAGIDEANALAMQMATAVAIGSMLILGYSGWQRWLCVLAMPFVLNTLILAGSRGAFLSLLSAGVVLWYMRPLAHRKMFYVFAILGVVAFARLAHDMFWERMGTIGAAVETPQEIDVSAKARIELAKAQWVMAADNPMGTGHRGTAVLSQTYLDRQYWSINDQGEGARSSHNTFLSALVEQGIPGAVLFASLWIWWLRTALSLRRLERTHLIESELGLQIAAVAAALTVIFIAGMFVDYLKAETQIWMFATLAALAGIARRKVSDKVPVEKASVTGNQTNVSYNQ